MSSNSIKLAFLFTSIIAIFTLVGSLLGGCHGAIVALIFAFGMNFFTYWFSDTIILKMHKAEEVNSHQFPKLHQIVKKLALCAKMPTPRVFIMDEDIPNAFATGRNSNNAVVAVTKKLLEIMNKKELEGVLAHELAHIKNRDILITTVIATITGAIMMIASMARWSIVFGGYEKNEGNSTMRMLNLVVISIVAPLAATIIQMAISRNREYLADSIGASIANSPDGLAHALKKLESYSYRSKINVNPSTAHMFIISPLSGKKFHNLFSTHPPINERVHRLLGKDKNKQYINKTGNNGKEGEINVSGRKFWEHVGK